MPVPTLITDLSTVAASNSPDGASESPKLGDDYIRTYGAFIAQIRDMLNGTSNSGTIKNPVFSGAATGSLAGATFATPILSDPTISGTPVIVSSAVTWAGSPTHSGNHTFSGYLDRPNMPAVSAFKTSAQTIAAGAVTTLIFNSEIVDRSASYDNTTGIFTAPRAGTYLVSFSAYLTNTSGAASFFGESFISKNNSGGGSSSIAIAACKYASNESISSGSGAFVASTSWVVLLAVSDTIRVKAAVNSGGSLTAVSDSCLSIVYLG